MGDISKNFSFSEFEASETAELNGIDNTIPERLQQSIINLTIAVLQPTRGFLKFCITISSGYRCKTLNSHPDVRGSNSSQHVKAEAADLKSEDNAAIFNYIRENLEFDQLIWEFGDDNQPQWVHVSFKQGANRGQVKKAFKRGGETIYKLIGTKK